MNISIEDIIAKSKDRLNNLFFRIVKDGDGYQIMQYVGPQKSSNKMLEDGWNKHAYLADYINHEYPVLDINDFKTENGFTLIKKNDDDILKDSFKEIMEYFEMNRSLAYAFSSFKKFIQKLGIDFMKFSVFEELLAFSKNYIESLSLSQIDKANLLYELTNIRIKIFEELEKMNIEHPISFLSQRFRYFLMIAK